MLNEISNASSDVGVFGEYRMKSSLSEQTSKMLDEYGYILDTEINQILKLDKMFNRKYWEKQVERIGKNV
jgi:ribosomal protein S8